MSLRMKDYVKLEDVELAADMMISLVDLDEDRRVKVLALLLERFCLECGKELDPCDPANSVCHCTNDE